MAEVCEQAGADVLPLAEALGYDARIGRRERVVALARQAAGGSLAGCWVAVLGVAFKPGQRRRAAGTPPAWPSATAWRPRGRSCRCTTRWPCPARPENGRGWGCAPSVSEAAEGADLVLHLTEWSDYRAIDPAALARAVARRVIIDARCCLDAGLWREAGWTVHVLGRPRAIPMIAKHLDPGGDTSRNNVGLRCVGGL